MEEEKKKRREFSRPIPQLAISLLKELAMLKQGTHTNLLNSVK